MVLLILMAWMLPAHAQGSINLDFTVAQTEQSHSEPAAATPTIASPSEANKDGANKDDDRKQDTIALSFAVPEKQATTIASNPAPVVKATAPTVAASDLFVGGSNSLVARTVGHAEGTRTADGSKTRAYYGHSDPGNGVWNLGSFSYQHAAQSPEEADEKQLRRLQTQADTLRQRAASHRLTLSLEEELNAIDLANQAPLAALDTPGYIEWLKQARDRGLSGSEAVLWARTQSYWNPRRNRWEAPGLGNTEDGISHDQNRRLTAIARALDHYQQQQIAQQQEHDQPQNDRQAKIANKPPQEQVADRIIFQDLSSPKAEAVAQASH
ncbi:MAG: hypothetical protein KME45_28090 [Stenomitos rutilans HA7619-LM2]|nr:hypothetical protein [Stenomitos rutilans HA7619-LM2]